MKDLYRILQVHPEADQETIQAAYRSLLRRVHPDKNPDRKEWAEKQARELNEAYAILGDVQKRLAYDRERERFLTRQRTYGPRRPRRDPGPTRTANAAQAYSYVVLQKENRRLEEEVFRLRGENARLRMEIERIEAQANAREEQLEDLRRRLVDADTQRRRLEQALAVAEKQRDLLRERQGDRPDTSEQTSGETPTDRESSRRRNGRRTARSPKTRSVELPHIGGGTLTFVWIPGGTFPMGSEVGNADEQPVHPVTLDGFWMSATLITARQFAAFVRAEPKWSPRVHVPGRPEDYLRHFQGDTPPAGQEACPVTWVTWHAAAAFCEWAGFRLPTEAEWEYAARGGEGLRYGTSNGTLMTRLANYGAKVGSVTPVRRYPPNPFGLFDMAGNVWEWCADRYDAAFYGTPEATEPNPQCGPRYRFRDGDWEEADGRFVIRGGSWQSLSADLRTSARAFQEANRPTAFCGFRCVLPE